MVNLTTRPAHVSFAQQDPSITAPANYVLLKTAHRAAVDVILTVSVHLAKMASTLFM